MPRRAVGFWLLALALAACAPGPGGPQSCRATTDCSRREYCARPIGKCEAAGTCQPRPQVCLQLYAPVCGCDGVDYSNACRAAAHGVSVERADLCPAPQAPAP